MRRRVAGSLAVLAAALAAFAAAATGADPVQPSLTARPDFEVTPRKLPPAKPMPARLSVSMRYRYSDETQVPALKELRLEGDKHIGIDLGDVSPCRMSGSGVKEDHSDSCPGSVIGRGTISVDMAFVGDEVIPLSAPLTVWFGSRKRGGAKLIAYAFLKAPVSAELVIPVEVGRLRGGRIGWEATAAIPKIAGGFGSVTDFKLTIGRRLLSATCSGYFKFRAVSTFADGTRLGEGFVRPCAVAEPDVRQ